MGEEPERIYDVKRFLQLAKRYSDIQELDAITVNKLLEKIVMYILEKIDGRKHMTIESFFTECRLDSFPV